MADTKGIDINFNDLAKGIFKGDITPRKLPEDLYHKTASNLLDPLHKAFHGDMGKQPFMSPNYKLLSELSNNIYMFSAAKTFQQVKAVSELMVHGDKIVPFNEFKKQAIDVLGLYNDQYLAAEHDTAEMMARSAEKWNKIQAEKETFPYLRYSDVEDSHECEICGGLHGTVARVDDDFWDQFMPPNHFFCRCTVEQVDGDDDIPSGDLDGREEMAKELMDPLFLMNPGKDKVIYQNEGPNKHPYFIVPKEYQEFASDNFDLPMPTYTGLSPMQQNEFESIPRSTNLSPEDAQLQEQSIKQFVENKEELIDQYIKDNGNIANTDACRKYFKGYTGTNAAAFHEASSAMNKAIQERLLEGDKGKVVSLAGGAGSGKSSVVNKMFKDAGKESDMLLDGTMSKPSSSLLSIYKWLSMDKDVDIDYVYRDPEDAWKNGVIHRMLFNKEEMGRAVTMSAFIDNTTGALKTMHYLVDKGVNKINGVNINIIDNSLGAGKAAMMDGKKFSTLSIQKDIRELLMKDTKELLDNGTITKEQYDQLIK